MAVLGLIVLVLFVAAVVNCLPNKTYTCGECGYSTPDRQDAAGHQFLGTLHKMPL